MKLWTSEHVFDHPWETVVQASWRKYPNPINPAVTGVDTIERRVDDDGVLRSKRVLRTLWGIPNWATAFGLQNPTYSYEHSEVNPAQRTMQMKTINMNCTNYVSIDEQLTYKPHPEDVSKTILEQTTSVSVQGMPLIDHVENIIVSAFRQNTSKGREAMEWVIGKIKAEMDEIASTVNTEYSEITNRLSLECLELSEGLKHHLHVSAASTERHEHPS